MTVRVAALIPTFDNPRTVREVVLAVRRHLEAVWIVDDGSAEAGRRACEALAAEGLATVIRRASNGGKGAAVKQGFRALLAAGFTHALTIDADGQHDVDDIPKFLAAAEREPNALIAGAPSFDASAPAARLYGRKISTWWCALETLGLVITDPLCGMRLYPLGTAVAAGVRANAMDFDPEIAVRVAWAGAPVINLPTRVRYFSREEGGVSHFRMLRDNALISWMHTRQVCALVVRMLTRPRPRRLSA